MPEYGSFLKKNFEHLFKTLEVCTTFLSSFKGTSTLDKTTSALFIQQHHWQLIKVLFYAENVYWSTFIQNYSS